MPNETIKHVYRWATALGYGAASMVMVSLVQAAQVVELTQVPCQFLESEGGTNRGYASRSIKDCEAINDKTSQQRLAEARPLVLKPGKYVFHVANKDVPDQLGLLAARRYADQPRHAAQRIRRRDHARRRT